MTDNKNEQQSQQSNEQNESKQQQLSQLQMLQDALQSTLIRTLKLEEQNQSYQQEKINYEKQIKRLQQELQAQENVNKCFKNEIVPKFEKLIEIKQNENQQLNQMLNEQQNLIKQQVEQIQIQNEKIEQYRNTINEFLGKQQKDKENRQKQMQKMQKQLDLRETEIKQLNHILLSKRAKSDYQTPVYLSQQHNDQEEDSVINPEIFNQIQTLLENQSNSSIENVNNSDNKQQKNHNISMEIESMDDSIKEMYLKLKKEQQSWK